MRTNLTDAMMQAARDKLERLHRRRALMKPDESFVAIDTEIRRTAEEIASAYARSQNQLDCEPAEVAEWIETPDEPGEPEIVRWSPVD
jgi:hypothetical protein